MRRSLAGNASGGSIRAAAALTAGVLVAGLIAPASVFAGDASPPRRRHHHGTSHGQAEGRLRCPRADGRGVGAGAGAPAGGRAGAP